MPASNKDPALQSFLLGIGLDGTDGHRRITRGCGFHLEGGSSRTHELLQDTLQRVVADLERQGTAIPGASPEQLRRAIRDALGS
jgi:hypothetical protein